MGEGGGGGGEENELKLWGIGSTRGQLPTIKLKFYLVICSQSAESLFGFYPP